MTKTSTSVSKTRKPRAKPEGENKSNQVEEGERRSKRLTNLATSPELAALRIICGAEQDSALKERIDCTTLIDALRMQAVDVIGGDLKQAEAMLINQATALQSLFARLAERGMACSTLPQFEVDMRVALRAQSQCRATLETLATIKNPPIVYARQANIANGPQQVNNGTPSQAREIESEQSKLSGGGNELLPDGRASALASRVDTSVEALGEINGAKVTGG